MNKKINRLTTWAYSFGVILFSFGVIQFSFGVIEITLGVFDDASQESHGRIPYRSLHFLFSTSLFYEYGKTVWAIMLSAIFSIKLQDNKEKRKKNPKKQKY